MLYAQASVDPNHPFYTDAKRWEILGLTERQPVQKPYPVNLIDHIITQVENSGNVQEAEIATRYRKELIEKPVTFFAETLYKPVASQDTNTITFHFGGYGDVAFNDMIGIGYSISDYVTNKRVPASLRYSGFENDTNGDAAEFGSLKAFLETNTVFSFGNPHLYVISGIGRVHTGNNLYDSLMISGNSYHAPYATIAASAGPLSFIQGIQCIEATTGYGTIQPDHKFLSYHEITWEILSWLTVNWFETAVYGKQFDLKYLFPSMYMTSESFGGFSEGNILMGLGGELSILPRFRIWGNGFLDDVNVNEVVKGNFDTRITGSGMAGIQYVPENSRISLITGTYTLITPWMYTHYDGNGYANDLNVQNYTHHGKNKATQLEPNSHRLALQVETKPVKNLSVSLGLSGIQHGNISESLTVDEAAAIMKSGKTYITDGSYQQNGHSYNNSYNPSYLNKFQFLEQETIESIVQFSSQICYAIPDFHACSVTFNAEYCFEYIHNDGINRNMFNANSYGKYEGTDAQRVKQAHDVWKSEIIPHTVNNYITFGIKVSY